MRKIWIAVIMVFLAGAAIAPTASFIIATLDGEPSLANTSGTLKIVQSDKDLLFAEYGNMKTSEAYWSDSFNSWMVELYDSNSIKLRTFSIDHNASATQTKLDEETDFFVNDFLEQKAKKLRALKEPNPLGKTGRNYSLGK